MNGGSHNDSTSNDLYPTSRYDKDWVLLEGSDGRERRNIHISSKRHPKYISLPKALQSHVVIIAHASITDSPPRSLELAITF